VSDYLVRIKPPSGALQHVTAVRAEIHGEHLVFLNSEGKLAALFLMEIVESWNEINRGGDLAAGVATKPGLARRSRCEFLDP
jgi:hypothetical protein